MKILYDHQIFGIQKFGGISRYFFELITRLPEEYCHKNSLVYSDNIYIKDSNKINTGLKLPRSIVNSRLIGIANKNYSKITLSVSKYDVFHPTYYNPYFLKILKYRNIPYVVTVYDMIHEKFKDIIKNDITSEYKRETVINADRIIAISHNTKRDIIDMYGIDESKIDVVHLGHSVDINHSEPIIGLPSRYILFVGQRQGYKNFGNYIKACGIIHKKYPEIKFVCTGSDFNEDEKDLIKNLGLEDTIVRYFVSDTQLTYLYKNAICFVYPSLYEGFGIPILESYAAGCPLALSNTSCFPEIAQDGGAYFNPYEIDDIAGVLEDLIENKDKRESLVNRGYEILSQYSWDKMAKETADIYKQLI